MSRIQWTKDQEKIINARGADVLVSAAAGSGKTAVLVERIYQQIVDRDHPVNVDQFVVVTFTHAAAAQMQERLRERLEEAIEKNPENRHLQRQIPRMASAHISTVHGFCGYIIQNYFHRIGLDPSYRQGTESELALIQQDVLAALLEEEYEEQQPDFLDFAGIYLFNRTDKQMESWILSLYDKAMSQPFPLGWLEQMEASFQVEDEISLDKTPVFQFIREDVEKVARGILEECDFLLRICQEPDGPYVYEKNVQEIRCVAEDICRAAGYEEIRSCMKQMEFSKMSSKRDDTIHKEKREMVKRERNECKEVLLELRDSFFYQELCDHLKDLHKMSGHMLTLIRLTKKFMERYTEEKRERNVVDFNDLEQLAISILLEWDEEQGEYVRSEAAREMADYFEEIMIDEYQDSNHVQDKILTSVSRDGLPGRKPNIFMVGDVKQSIYRFRNACPELFSEKLDRYSMEAGAKYRRIDLHQNFRSRDVVLQGSNCVFQRIMHRDIGDVEYDEHARLRPGRVFEDAVNKRAAEKTEVCVIQGGSDAEAEARLAAVKIKEMVEGPDPLFIQEDQEVRPASYRDIVILARSTKSVGQKYFQVLKEAGIPVVMEQSRGFFDTREIRLMTEMLQVIDNPRDDLALAGVLCSPLFQWTEEELACVRMADHNGDLYQSLLAYHRGGGMEPGGQKGIEREDLKQKTADFLETLLGMREKTSYATVQELIQDIYDKTGIYDSVKMMPDGVQRTANMDGLMERAREFDSSASHGLYSFMRYIQRIQEQKEDIGEINVVGEEENVVRIMTMHKSKGLEFPICILLGLGRKFGGRGDDFFTVQPDWGIASPIVDNEQRTKKETLYRQVFRRKNMLDDLGEEMRVLYVAMTRAKEKLVLIGCGKEIEGKRMNYFGRSKIANFLDMILPAALEEPNWFQVESVDREELLADAAAQMVRQQVEEDILNNFDTNCVYHEGLKSCLEEYDDDPQGEPEVLPVKVSVSELKIKSMQEQEIGELTLFTEEEEQEEEMPVPDFMKNGEIQPDSHKGAAYGTIWHQVMATIDFAAADSEEGIRRAVQELIRTGRLRREEEKVLDYRRLMVFFSSPLGKAMREADAQGRLHREQPFVTTMPACDIYPDRAETQGVLIQGIIDGYYETEEGIVLMDYKTDSLKPGEESHLVDRYRIQMELYRKALEEILATPVRESILYSFSLGKEIVC